LAPENQFEPTHTTKYVLCPRRQVLYLVLLLETANYGDKVVILGYGVKLGRLVGRTDEDGDMERLPLYF
jgi:hypothetical protein